MSGHSEQLDIQWRDEDFTFAREEIHALRDKLGQSLLENVRPESLVISGGAVQDALDTDFPDSSWNVGPAPRSHVAVERWAAHGRYLVHISRSTDASAGLLARQVSQKYGMIPTVTRRRTDKIAGLTAMEPALRVSIFNNMGTFGQFDDETLAAAREMPIGELIKTPEFHSRIVIGSHIPAIDKKTVSETAWAYGSGIQYSHLNADSGIRVYAGHTNFDQPNGPNTPEYHAQAFINRRIAQLEFACGALMIASDAIRLGTQIYPSKPIYKPWG